MSDIFEIGDRVRLNWDMRDRVDDGPDFYCGITGTVVVLDDDRLYDIGVRWDFDRPDAVCHTLDGRCEDGYGWWVPSEALLPEKDLPSVDSDVILSILMGGDGECM